MSPERRDCLINRIISGEIHCRVLGDYYVVKQPDKETRYKASILYEDCLFEANYYGWPDSNDLSSLLISCGICSTSNFSEIEKRIEDLKVDLFKSFLSLEKQKNIRKMLDAVKAKYNEMLNTIHCLDYVTPEGFALTVKTQYLVASSVYYNGQRLWSDENILNADYHLLDSIMHCVNESRISITEFREIARTEPWRTYWSLNKSNIFQGIPTDWTEEQRTLSLISKMYDSIYDSPDCPSDKVIEDDDMLDGWLIINKRKRDKEKMDAQLNLVSDKKNNKNFAKSNAQEIFIPARSKEEIEQIHSLNSVEGTMIKRQREATIKKHGVVKDSQLPDNVLDIRKKIQENYVNTVKGRK